MHTNNLRARVSAAAQVRRLDVPRCRFSRLLLIRSRHKSLLIIGRKAVALRPGSPSSPTGMVSGLRMFDRLGHSDVAQLEEKPPHVLEGRSVV